MTNSSLQIEINDLPIEVRKKVAAYVAKLREAVLKPNQPETRALDFAKGKIWMSSDFDEPLKDFTEYM
jgi:hypothetical protein